jgi:hypothetical protein
MTDDNRRTKNGDMCPECATPGLEHVDDHWCSRCGSIVDEFGEVERPSDRSSVELAVAVKLLRLWLTIEADEYITEADTRAFLDALAKRGGT